MKQVPIAVECLAIEELDRVVDDLEGAGGRAVITDFEQKPRTSSSMIRCGERR